MENSKNKSPKTNLEPVIQVRNLLIEFGSGRSKNKVVKGVTFDVYKGETFGIVGESGSGKTTIARAIMGIQPISDGTIYFKEKLARGKQPDLEKLSLALSKNLNILIENQEATTIKIQNYSNEYKRIYFKYIESKYFNFKTGGLNLYEDGINRQILEGTNLKETKIITSDKENNLKQISLHINDSLKRIIKIVRILQKTIQFTDHLHNYVNVNKKLNDNVSKYLDRMFKKVIVLKEQENEIYYSTKKIQKIRSNVLDGEYNSISLFFNDIGYQIEKIVSKHKEIEKTINSIKDITFFIRALVCKKSSRSFYWKSIIFKLEELNQKPREDNLELKKDYQTVLDLMDVQNDFQTAISNSYTFAKNKSKENKELKQKMQMIFQDPASSLNDRMSVEEIISEGISNFPHLYKNGKIFQEYFNWYNLYKTDENKISIKDVTAKKVKNYLVLKQLESVGMLPEHLSRYPHEFSGGQRQRIGVARALIMKPELIVADEPISALDVSIRAQILNLMNKFKKQDDLTYIFIAHDLSVVKKFVDRIAVIYQGDIVELAPAKELFDSPLHPYTKSLLSVVPGVNPDEESLENGLIYDAKEEHFDYLVDFPFWQEIKSGHFVYANKREFKNYQKELKITKKQKLPITNLLKQEEREGEQYA